MNLIAASNFKKEDRDGIEAVKGEILRLASTKAIEGRANKQEIFKRRQ